MTAKIAADTFFKRADALMRVLQSDDGDGVFKGVSVLLLVFGKAEDKMPYSKTSAVFRWLVGYDFTDTALLIDKRLNGKITFVTSAVKEEIIKSSLSSVPQGILDGRAPVEVDVILRGKTTEKNDVDRIVSRLKAGKVGVVKGREPHSGSFAQALLEAVQDVQEGIKLEDVTQGIAHVLARKDGKDVNAIRSSCSISDVVMKKMVVPRIEEEANDMKKISPSKLSDYIEGYFRDPARISNKLQPQFVESCYPPLFSSASSVTTDLTRADSGSTGSLEYTNIVCSIGARYRSLCSSVTRTVLINPTDATTSAHAALVAAFDALTSVVKPGNKISEAYRAARRALAERDAALAEVLDPCVGHSMGYEFHESLLLTETTPGNFESGMVFNVLLLLQKFSGKNVLALGDTVLVTDTGCEVLTKAPRDLSYDLEGDKGKEEEEEEEEKGKGKQEVKEEDVTGKRKSRMREQTSLQSEAEMKERQQQNFERLQRELARKAEMGVSSIGAESNEATAKDWLTLNPYPNGASSFPNDAAPHRLVVDQENETILIPINGYVVPVHISLIKQVTKLDDTIRFQFIVPGKGKMSQPANLIIDEQPNVVWIKEVVYHLKNSNLLSSIERSIKEMRKRVTAQEKRKADLAGLAEQDALLLSREKPLMLTALYARPALAGKRVLGTLEAHRNGFRYTTNKGNKLDVLYNNIKHAFFQPAEGEALVILHFNLINPIVVGKRKTSDIQFVQETMEASSRLDSRKHAFGDADEIEEEQREKAARKKINRTFFKFCKDVEEFAKKNDPEGEEVFKFDFPSRELGFNGVPFKSHVFLQPTAHDCLVHLVEGPPFFVMSLDDVEVASFERVRFGLRQFDLIFILKDYSKDPITINSIPVEALETLQEWLSKSNILFYVNPQPYNWNNLMQEIRAKPLKQFLDEGGWSFLGREESDEEKEGGGGEAMEEGSEEYEPEGSSSESDFEDEDDGDDDDDGGGGDDDDDEDGGDDDEEEEAEDWDELERKAEASDKKRWGETKKTVQLPVGKKAKKSD